ncbi:MAG: hypothetical protein AAGA48_31955 [Myxococcota bacterium]
MTALSPRASTLPARITGRPLAWARDTALVGGVTATSATLALGLMGTTFGLAAGLTGALAGFALGLEMPTFLDSARRRLSLISVGLRCITIGFGLGGFVGLIAATAAGNPYVLGPIVVAGIAGALQLGWWWLPYTVLTVTQRPTWPAVLIACAVAPFVGPLAQWISALIVALIL